jgi:prepilin-type N-terminal cleavage/methylation domain-containing protein
MAGEACRQTSERGFTLIDMVAVVALIGIISAIALPSMLSARDRIRLGQAAREVERELQSAKARAVAKSRPMRVHFNCPGDGEYRAVELIGTAAAPVAADSATNRCSSTVYPYPPADTDPNTRPNLDGPVRTLDSSVTFSVSQTIEFHGDGTAYRDAGAGTFEMIPTTGVNIRVAREGLTRTITVNGLGKVQLQ